MNLKDIFDRQTAQQRNWYDPDRLTSERRAELTKELGLGLYEEVQKLVRRVDLSRYHVLMSPPAPEAEQVAHDAVGAFKMLVALAALHGVTPDMFSEEFTRVSRVVDDKWRGQNMELSAEIDVLLCDLDGCVADWTTAFAEHLGFAGGKAPDGFDFNAPSLEPHKDEFDRSGGYRRIKPIAGAIETLRLFQGYHPSFRLVIVTARPYQRFKRVYSDTLEWCERVGLKHDHILFLRDKAEAVRRMAPARILGFVEDRAKHAIEVALTGTTVFKMPFPASQESVSHANIIHVNGWDQIRPFVVERILNPSRFPARTLEEEE
jgi:hypothetical protein